MFVLCFLIWKSTNHFKNEKVSGNGAAEIVSSTEFGELKIHVLAANQDSGAQVFPTLWCRMAIVPQVGLICVHKKFEFIGYGLIWRSGGPQDHIGLQRVQFCRALFAGARVVL